MNRWNIHTMGYLPFFNQLDQEADLILTDPPYTISKKTGFKNFVNGVERFAVDMDFGEWDKDNIDMPAMSKCFYDGLRHGGTAIVWCDVWKMSHLKDAMENAGFSMFRMIIWQKTNPVPINSKAAYLSNSREVALFAVKGGKATFHSSYDNGIYEMPIPRHGGKKIHPTQKPIDLFEQLVLKHSNPGDLVVDSFLGSGTTAVAAIKHGRDFEGCDIFEDYTQKAIERMEDEFKGIQDRNQNSTISGIGQPRQARLF